MDVTWFYFVSFWKGGSEWQISLYLLYLILKYICLDTSFPKRIQNMKASKKKAKEMFDISAEKFKNEF